MKALNDLKRMKKITKIKTYLKTNIKEIVQHQNLFERNLINQCKNIARRKIKFDELKKSFIENMLITNKKQRVEMNFVFKIFFIRFQQVFNFCACNQASNFDKAKMIFEAKKNIKNEMNTFCVLCSFDSILVCFYLYF